MSTPLTISSLDPPFEGASPNAGPARPQAIRATPPFRVSVTETRPETTEKPGEKIQDAFDKGWNVIVWNDPVNLMSYVVHVFMRVLGFNKAKATKHMLEVHQLGKSLVATETRERAELYHQQIQAHGLQVTIEQSG